MRNCFGKDTRQPLLLIFDDVCGRMRIFQMIGEQFEIISLRVQHCLMYCMIDRERGRGRIMNIKLCSSPSVRNIRNNDYVVLPMYNGLLLGIH